MRQGAAVVATTTATATPSLLVRPQIASAADESYALESVYFGVGCFWHIQHEFAVAERDLLNRNKSQLTCKTGYAGGNQLGDEGKVCYHNFLQVADYGRMGHGEVVGMELPTDQIVPFAQVYFSLFDPKTKDRVDPGDRGGEYRSLMGLPGGTSHSLYPEIVQVAQTAGFILKPGKGNDPDTLRQQLVYVYDTKQFPFHQAEVYHQFHVSSDVEIPGCIYCSYRIALIYSHSFLFTASSSSSSFVERLSIQAVWKRVQCDCRLGLGRWPYSTHGMSGSCVKRGFNAITRKTYDTPVLY